VQRAPAPIGAEGDVFHSVAGAGVNAIAQGDACKGSGIGGLVHGETDEFCYNIVRDPVHVHDFNATLLHQLGIDHERLTYRFQGRDFRLTDIHGKLVGELVG
jgi:hypothetical protein